jgi:signal transduction histidine kinase
MIKASIPVNEANRIKALESYNILDTLADDNFDSITLIASQICAMPISLISFVDIERQWFKSHFGTLVQETHRDFSFCAHSILNENEIFEVKDLSIDERFHDNPLVAGSPFARFYAGVPLLNKDGFALGTLCVLDYKPRELSQIQKNILKSLSKQIVAQLEMTKTIRELQFRNEETNRFAYLASHDIKAPIRGMKLLANNVLADNSSILDDVSKLALNLISNRADQLTNLVNGILTHSVLEEDKLNIEKIILIDFVTEIFDFIGAPENVKLTHKIEIQEIYSDITYLHQILQNLLSNAIKYSDKDNTEVHLHIFKQDGKTVFTVKDNGSGIPIEFQQSIFQIFKTLVPTDRFGNKGSGIGLATVKRLAEKMNGTITVSSVAGKGSEFTVIL